MPRLSRTDLVLPSLECEKRVVALQTPGIRNVRVDNVLGVFSANAVTEAASVLPVLPGRTADTAATARGRRAVQLGYRIRHRQPPVLMPQRSVPPRCCAPARSATDQKQQLPASESRDDGCSGDRSRQHPDPSRGVRCCHSVISQRLNA